MREDSTAACSAAVACDQVHFRRSDSRGFCLELDALNVARGERVFIHGPSGSGKSTLLSLIGGVLDPDRGSISVLGVSLDTMRGGKRDRFRAANIGFIFQLFNLVPYLSARENILLPCRFSAERAARLRNSIHDEVERLSHRLDLDASLLDRPAFELSVGQQQRVAAARALIGRPGLVIADEPTSALDADRQRAFLDLLLGECEEAAAALLFVSHDDRLTDRFDRVVRLGELNRAGLTPA